MKKLMTCLALGTFATLLGVASAPAANAQSDRENSTFTVTEPLEIGSFTLQPGTYFIKVLLLASNRSTLQVTNVEQTTVFATVLAVPHLIQRDEMVSERRFIYYATASGQPRALRTWFARDASNGQDIVYSKQRAMELAAATKEPVIAIPDAVKEPEYKTVALTVVTPDQKMKPYEEPVVVIQKAPEPAPAVVVAEARPVEQLPATASHVPLFAALGLLSLGGAIGLRALANRAA
jgi:hypothetical protein